MSSNTGMEKGFVNKKLFTGFRNKMKLCKDVHYINDHDLMLKIMSNKKKLILVLHK